jgi:hypothetical protein
MNRTIVFFRSLDSVWFYSSFILHPSSFRETPVQIALDPIILNLTESSREARQTHRLATLVCASNFMGGY